MAEKEKTNEVKTNEVEKNTKYFGVYYANSGEILISEPQNTKEDALKWLDKKLAKKEIRDFCKATTVIQRDLNNISKPEYIFGCPKALNLKK